MGTLKKKEAVSNFIQLDISLGIETSGGVMTTIVMRNSTIPTTRSPKIFTTCKDNQPAVTIKVYEGEHALTTHNKLLGRFNLEGIPPAVKGVPQIEVTFDIDQNNKLTVRATEKNAQNSKEMVIENEKEEEQLNLEGEIFPVMSPEQEMLEKLPQPGESANKETGGKHIM